jgi:hypothetical protein
MLYGSPLTSPPIGVIAHRELSRLAQQRATLDAEEGRWLLAAPRSAAHVHLGFGSFSEYVERMFGYSPRWTQEKLRGAEALEELPSCAVELILITLCGAHHRAIHRAELVVEGLLRCGGSLHARRWQPLRLSSRAASGGRFRRDLRIGLGKPPALNCSRLDTGPLTADPIALALRVVLAARGLDGCGNRFRVVILGGLARNLTRISARPEAIVELAVAFSRPRPRVPTGRVVDDGNVRRRTSDMPRGHALERCAPER